MKIRNEINYTVACDGCRRQDVAVIVAAKRLSFRAAEKILREEYPTAIVTSIQTLILC